MIAGNTKLSRAITSQQDIETLQEDLNKIKGHLHGKFNVEKCKVTHMGGQKYECKLLIKGRVFGRIQDGKGSWGFQ